MIDTNELRKASMAVFLATNEPIAQDLSNKLKGAADEIDQLRDEIDKFKNHIATRIEIEENRPIKRLE